MITTLASITVAGLSLAATLAPASGPTFTQQDNGPAVGSALPSQTPAARNTSNQRFSGRESQTERFGPTARFVVEAVSITAIDESGFDWAGSDQVYAIWSSAGVGVQTSTFTGVDTGDIREFDGTEKCIYPIQAPAGDSMLFGDDDEWGCAASGGAAPLEFSVALFEEDGPPHICSEFLIYAGVPLKNCSDDMIGWFNFSLTEQQLVQTFASEGTSRAITRTLGGTCGYVKPNEVKGCSDWGPTGPEYEFRFRITRVADAKPLVASQ